MNLFIKIHCWQFASTYQIYWHQAGIIEQILAEYPDQVRFIFRDFPVIYPTYDRMAAEIAQCALDQGEEGFWRLHDALYTTIPPGSSQVQFTSVFIRCWRTVKGCHRSRFATQHYGCKWYTAPYLLAEI